MNTQPQTEPGLHAINQGALVAASELFADGSIHDAGKPKDFILRANTYVCRRRIALTRVIPATLSDAIHSDGSLMPHAELIAFGTWLLIDGQPGMRKTPGKKANPTDVLKFVGAIISALRTRRLRKSWDPQNTLGLAKGERLRRKQEISKHDIAKHWTLVFREEMQPKQIDAKLRSAKRILTCYLDYLANGKSAYSGKQILKSPEIRQALTAISMPSPIPSNGEVGVFTEPHTSTPATADPFEINLQYQSVHLANLYRNHSPGANSETRLKYISKVAAPTIANGSNRPTRSGKITLHPDVKIKDTYRAVALVDRIAITLELAKSVSSRSLQSIIADKTGTSPFVYDFLDFRSKPPEWGVPLTEPDTAKLVGHPYAIMIQNPTPALLANVIQTISNTLGMAAPAKLHLVEVSLDFYPREVGLPVHERVTLRERIVGILQRHHWISAAELYDPELSVPRKADARQVLNKETHDLDSKPKVLFLFARNRKRDDPNARMCSDSDIARPGIRKRILVTNPGYDLHLNSTLVKGGRNSPIHVSIQHKIADTRNPQKQTKTILTDEQRRARIEVTLSGTKELQQRGLHKVSDLRAINFRTLTKGTLTFKLPEIEPFEHLMDDAKAQLRTRGVYGIDLRTRALHLEKREALRRSGQKVPRKQEREGMALKDWKEMNKLVGDALDGLTRRWKGFTAP